MNRTVITIATEGASRHRKRQAPKGRAVDPALDEVRASLGTARARRDRLIEHLHPLQDRYGHLADRPTWRRWRARCAAVAGRGLRGRELLSPLRRRAQERRRRRAAALTVRVCDGLSCEMAGARDLLAQLPAMLGADVRVIAGALHRPLRAGAGGGSGPAPGGARELRRACSMRCGAAQPMAVPRAFHRPEAYRAAAATRCCATAPRAGAMSNRCCTTLEDTGLRGLGGAGFPAGRKWRIVRAEAGAAPDGGEHRRRRARHLQGPRLPRTRSAPLHRRHADRGLGGRHRAHLHLPARRVPRLPRAAARPSWRGCAAHPPIRRCRASNCGAAPAPTSAAKSRR